MSIFKLSETKFKINFWVLEAETTWEVTQAQRNASWEMYVELITRISTAPLSNNEGLLRETLNSFHTFFKTTREILKKYGPEIAKENNPGDITFGHIAVKVLNKELRPLLGKWHPLLTYHESKNLDGKSSVKHEQEWIRNDELREAIEQTRLRLLEYAEVLGEVSESANLL